MDHLGPLSTIVAPSARAMLGGEHPPWVLDQDVVDRALVHARRFKRGTKCLRI
jgi:hypothetical protein